MHQVKMESVTSRMEELGLSFMAAGLESFLPENPGKMLLLRKR